ARDRITCIKRSKFSALGSIHRSMSAEWRWYPWKFTAPPPTSSTRSPCWSAFRKKALTSSPNGVMAFVDNEIGGRPLLPRAVSHRPIEAAQEPQKTRMRRERQELPFAARIALLLGLEPDALVHVFRGRSKVSC